MSYKSCTTVAFASLATVLCCGAAAQEKTPDWSKVQIKVSKVSGNIYMLEGQGGNIAASVGEDGIVIVDDEFAPLANSGSNKTLDQMKREKFWRPGRNGPTTFSIQTPSSKPYTTPSPATKANS
jgi:hypothetical protein